MNKDNFFEGLGVLFIVAIIIIISITCTADTPPTPQKYALGSIVCIKDIPEVRYRITQYFSNGFYVLLPDSGGRAREENLEYCEK